MAPKPKDEETLRELVRKMVDTQEETNDEVRKLATAVYGDSRAKIPGIVGKIEELEKSEAKRSKMYLLISAISAGVAIAIVKVGEFFKG